MWLIQVRQPTAEKESYCCQGKGHAPVNQVFNRPIGSSILQVLNDLAKPPNSKLNVGYLGYFVL